jgi:hypothetical protein
MKDEDLRELTARIRQEMEEIQRVLGRMKEGWERARRSNDDYYLDGVALNLHGFYSGVERIFAQIAETIDGQVPRGENWHQVLLQQMMDESIIFNFTHLPPLPASPPARCPPEKHVSSSLALTHRADRPEPYRCNKNVHRLYLQPSSAIAGFPATSEIQNRRNHRSQPA